MLSQWMLKPTFRAAGAESQGGSPGTNRHWAYTAGLSPPRKAWHEALGPRGCPRLGLSCAVICASSTNMLGTFAFYDYLAGRCNSFYFFARSIAQAPCFPQYASQIIPHSCLLERQLPVRISRAGFDIVTTFSERSATTSLDYRTQDTPAVPILRYAWTR